jgi:nucleoside-diphosphate-sugar epimerase
LLISPKGQESKMQKKTRVLVVGARGAFGNAVLQELMGRSGFEVAAFLRPDSEIEDFSGPCFYGDAGSETDLRQACSGMDVIVYGLNVPYQNWKREMAPKAHVLAQVAAAEKLRVVFPGNVYGLGDDFSKSLAEDCSHVAKTRKGAIRNKVEDILKESVSAGARLLILRAGDYFGPATTRTWVDFMMEKVAQGGALVLPETRPIPHAFAYLPDVARTVGELLEKEEQLGANEVFHFRGHEVTPTELLTEVRGLLADNRKIRPLTWWLMRPLALVSPMIREVLEMRYLWQEPVLLDDKKLCSFLGTVPHTPLRLALQRTLASKALLPGHDERNGDLDSTAEGSPLKAAS